MSSQGKWICDGEPKNNDQPYVGTGSHPPQENYGPDCSVCGLPREAMQKKTVMSSKGVNVPRFSLPIPVAIALLVLLGGGVSWYLATRGNQTQPVTDNGTPTPTSPSPQNSTALLSDTASLSNASLISQGEKILLDKTPPKQAGAAAFAQQDWDQAIALSYTSKLPLVGARYHRALFLPQIIFSGVLFELTGFARKLSWLTISRWSVGAYGALVDVNAMVPEQTPLLGIEPPPLPFAPTPVYDPTWDNLGLNWGILCVHTVVYLAISLWLQKRKDIC